MLQFMGLQRVGHNWVNELNWTDRYKLSDMKWGSRLSLQGSTVSWVELVLIWKWSFFRACAQSSGMNRLWVWWKKRSCERVKISSGSSKRVNCLRVVYLLHVKLLENLIITKVFTSDSCFCCNSSINSEGLYLLQFA